MLVPTQLLSTFAAVRATPCWTTAGNVHPMGACQPKWPTTSATALATAPGVDGCGVEDLEPVRRQCPPFELDDRSLNPRSAYVDTKTQQSHLTSLTAKGPGMDAGGAPAGWTVSATGERRRS